MKRLSCPGGCRHHLRTKSTALLPVAVGSPLGFGLAGSVVCISIYLSIYLSIYIYMYRRACADIYLFIYLYIFFPVRTLSSHVRRLAGRPTLGRRRRLWIPRVDVGRVLYLPNHMNGCQNYGPFLGPIIIRQLILRGPKRGP